jgi:hypothetical protein
VLATSTATGKTQPETIAAVLVHHDTNLYDLKVRADGRTAVIDTTSNHLFWAPGLAPLDQGRSTALRRLPPHGRRPLRQGHRRLDPRDSTGWMWDLTIPGDHDFYVTVSGASVLAHNCPAPKRMPLNLRIRRGIASVLQAISAWTHVASGETMEGPPRPPTPTSRRLRPRYLQARVRLR